MGKELYIFDALQLCHFLHTIKLAEMSIHERGYDVYEFWFVPYEFRIDEDIVHRDVVGQLDMLFSFVVSIDISSLSLE